MLKRGKGVLLQTVVPTDLAEWVECEAKSCGVSVAAWLRILLQAKPHIETTVHLQEKP